MSPIEDLPTVAEVNAVPHATPKRELETKLDRAKANKTARLADERELRRWALAVKHRDQWKDRKTGRRVLRTLSLDADRAEAHHIEPKGNWVTRYDIRNGLTLSYENHDKVERGDYRIEGTAWFTAEDGCRYIDGTAPVTFVRT
jgi:hypothetical protein